MVDSIYFELILKQMGFILKDGQGKKYTKSYPKYNDYTISVDFNKQFINYNENNNENYIIVHNNSITNFSKDENIVVLECVNRLLMKEYSPSSIELEKSWSSGHGKTNRLDILVKKDNVPYIMIECKTFGEKYEKEKNNMLNTKKIGKEEQPKGQLFTYCFQEKSTRVLCLYASKYDNNDIIYNNAIIYIDKNWAFLKNQKELYDHWNKCFIENGIFDKNSIAYNVKRNILTRSKLKTLSLNDSSIIFNQFLEILRHNAVSDKPNAFNKILNLFICKIIDEEKSENEELLFQWSDNSTYVDLQSNLEDLYKQGMERFLGVKVTDYSEKDIDDNLLLVDDTSKSIIKKMFQELRLQKNPEFAFKEVYNHDSFIENAIVLKEVVELLQSYQFRYGHKQQFLGDFFEQLLNTSIKQESGQFFTPIPIARFMVSSLPIREFLDKKIENNSVNVLPIMIDYACGAGHFLTEYMDVMQDIINNYNTINLGKNLKNKIEKWKQTNDENDVQGEFEWAKDCVYGLEKDYRLVKTSKISTFLNGDGEANIIHADGLDKFSSNKYKGLLISNSYFNNNFDFVIANPPYSVSAFRQTLHSNEDDFQLFQYLTENSSEIECLFVERTYQLLKEFGCAAIILPTSILSNGGILYDKTREILFKYFNIKAICEMGKNTFMATNTSTVIVFLEKRTKKFVSKAEKLINDFFINHMDFSFDGTQNIVEKYILCSYSNISFSEYISMLNGYVTDSVKKTDYYNNMCIEFTKTNKYKTLKNRKKNIYENEIDSFLQNYIIDIEKKKLLQFVLTYKNLTLIVSTGEKNAEKKFLGYEFSKRRKYEGIHLFRDKNGNISSSLYDDINLLDNYQKVNYLIRKLFLNECEEIPEGLLNNLKYISTISLFNFTNINYDTTIVLNRKPRQVFNCKSGSLSKYCNLKIGGTPARENYDYFTGKNLWVSIAEMNGQIICDTKEKITDEAVKNSNVKLIKKGTTLLSFKLSIGKVAIAGQDLYTNEAIVALEIKEEYKKTILDKYLFYLFKTMTIDLEGYTKSFGKSLNISLLRNILIPVIDIKYQKEFIEKCELYDNKITAQEDTINGMLTIKMDYIKSIFNGNFPQISLRNEEYIFVKRGPFGSDLKKEIFVSSGYKVYEQQNAINNNFSLGIYYITQEKFESMKSFEVKPKDIIMSCSGTIGKVALAPHDIEPGIINQALLRFRTTEKVLPEYLKICLEYVTDDLEHHGLGIHNLSSTDSLAQIKIPIPDSIHDQQHIVNEVLQFDYKIFDLEKVKLSLVDERNNYIKKYI